MKDSVQQGPSGNVIVMFFVSIVTGMLSCCMDDVMLMVCSCLQACWW